MSNKSEKNPKEEAPSTDSKEKDAPATPSGGTTPTPPASHKGGTQQPHFDKGITQR